MREGRNTIGAPLREALLRGETVLAPSFARELGVSRQGVSEYLSRLEKLGMVSGEKLYLEGTGTRIVRWTCIDREGIEGLHGKTAPETTSRREMDSAAAAPLLAVWGIGVADIDLPSTVHLMSEIDDLGAI